MTESLLRGENLRTQFRTEGGVVQAVDDVSFIIQPGETFALVGESGCGKSVTALSIMGLIPNPPGEITSGLIEFDGVDLLKVSSTEMRSIRGSKIGMIFQEPMSSLNPVLTIESQLAEPLKIHSELLLAAFLLCESISIPAPSFSLFDPKSSGINALFSLISSLIF